MEPKRDLEAMWDFLKKENAKIGIEEIGEGTVLNIVRFNVYCMLSDYPDFV